MFNDISIGYLTGSQKAYKNQLFRDDKVSVKRRTVAGMFFSPYTNKEEFIYCARHTFSPMLFLAFQLVDPFYLVRLSITTALVAGTLTLAGAGAELCGSTSVSSFLLLLAEEMISTFCQALIDLVLLPVSALVMITRGISTGLKAAGICDFGDSRVEDEPTNMAQSQDLYL